MPRPHPLLLPAALAALLTPVATAAAAEVALSAGPGAAPVVQRPIWYGDVVRLHGQVVDDAGNPVAAVEVRLVERSADGGPDTVSSLRTNAAGAFAIQVAPAGSTLYVAEVAADPTRAIAEPTTSRRVTVDVGARIENRTVRRQTGDPYRIAGRLKAPRPVTDGRLVLQLARTDRPGWRQLAATRADRGGDFHFDVTHARPGMYRYRIRFQPTRPRRLSPSELLFTVRVR